MSQLPTPGRPWIPDYGIPTSLEGTLPWSYFCERMQASIHYWIASTDPQGRPHATPVWGVWLDETFYFDGSPQTRSGRNLAANPAVTVHLEDGTKAVILQGDALEIHNAGIEFYQQLARTYAEKYKAMGYEPAPDTWASGGLWRVKPRLAFAWTKFPEDATRWVFE